jgi:hypothetical protein
MTSRELEDWLRTEDAHEATEPLPDQTGGHGRGHDVRRILGRRRTDLDRHDETVIREVVERVRTQRNEQFTTEPGDTVWRHRLMRPGHDPLKPIG